MKNSRYIAAALMAFTVLGGCATSDNLEVGRRIGPDYIGNGHLGDTRAYLYGGRTLVEQSGASAHSFRTPEGKPINAEVIEGKYYRLDGIANEFIADGSGGPMRVKLEPSTRVFSERGVEYQESAPQSVTIEKQE